MPNRFFYPIFFILFLASTPTHANWQYTRWGMSIEDLQNKNPKVTRLSEAGRKKHRMAPGFGEPAAQAVHEAAGIQTIAVFYFDKGGLSAVRLNTERNGGDAFRLLNAVKSVYGAPVEESRRLVIAGCTLQSWTFRDTKAKNIVKATVNHCTNDNESFGAVLFEPVRTKEKMGL